MDRLLEATFAAEQRHFWFNGFRHLHQAYTATDARYTGKVTVPTLWDKKTGRIVNNESSEIIRMLNSEFNGIAGDDADFYPKPLRAESFPDAQREASQAPRS